MAQRIAMHQTQEPAPVTDSREDCPDSLLQICNRMMTKDADARLQNCTEVDSYLSAFISNGDLPSETEKPEIQIDVTPARKPGSAKTSSPSSTKSSQPVSGDSPFAISTSNSTKTSAAKVLVSKNRKATTTTKKKSMPIPIWGIAVIIALMFLILIGVLIIASSYAK